MSTNRKNIVGKAPLANFTRNIKYRSIIVDRASYAYFCPQFATIMNEVNKTIQELSLLVETRHIPFVVCTPTTNDSIAFGNSRIVLIPISSDVETYCTVKDRRDISHWVEFQLSAAYEQITFSNSSCDAKFVIDKSALIPATTDLFLDLAMFNSYSFLQNMSTDEKRAFSKQKFDYFKKKNLPCYYEYDNKDTLLYYSLAFSARKGPKKFDMNMYIALWDDFLQTYYPNQTHKELSLALQLKQHIDFGQLPFQKILDELALLPKGAYLFIRLNRHPRSQKKQRELEAIFPGNTITFKNWKIIPLNEYTSIKKYAQTLYISVFKLIKA